MNDGGDCRGGKGGAVAGHGARRQEVVDAADVVRCGVGGESRLLRASGLFSEAFGCQMAF